MTRFDRLLSESRRPDASAFIAKLNQEALHASQELREFKLKLLERQLAGTIDFLLTPSFVNHMVNELEEYLRILQALQEGREYRCSIPCIMIWSGCRMLLVMRQV